MDVFLFIFIIITLPMIIAVIWMLFRNAVIDDGTIPQAECTKQVDPAQRRGMKTYGGRTDGEKKSDAASRTDTDNIQTEMEYSADRQTVDPKDIHFDRYAEHQKRGFTLQNVNERIASAREWNAGYDGGLDF